MNPTLSLEALTPILKDLAAGNDRFSDRYPGEPTARQAVHTVYGGAHLFRADSAQRLGRVARRFLDEFASDSQTLASAIGIENRADLPDLAETVFQRVSEKIDSEPVEDFRIDFEDGFGNRPDDEEDEAANTSATEVARGMREGTLPPFIGIRIKPLSAELHARGLRSLDLFVTRVVEESGGDLPANFVVTLPKVVVAEQVTALVEVFRGLEANLELSDGALKLELMVETTQSIVGPDGTCPLPAFVDAAEGRCVGAHFGVYDFTASCGITAEYQVMQHPACDFARQVMQMALAGTGVALSDGATNVLPVPVHKAGEGETLSSEQIRDNHASVHRAWRLHFEDVLHSLEGGYYQGWDLHPAQLVTRYAALYSFFLQSLGSASHRLRTFVERASQASLIGDVMDDAATGQGLLNFFLRGINCGAITVAEARATGLTLEEFQGRSFVRIIENRRG